MGPGFAEPSCLSWAVGQIGRLPSSLLVLAASTTLPGTMGAAWAIDAANISRPAAYVWTKPSEESATGPAAKKVAPATPMPAAQPAAQAVVAPPPAHKAVSKTNTLPLPSKPQVMANGKVFVPVTPKSKCTVKAGDSGTLEAQLRACAGL